jgi:hypothetical protein
VVPASNYSLTQGPFVIDQSVTIASAGAFTTNIVQDTTSATSRVFAIQKNGNLNLTPTVTISGLAMFYGKADSTNNFFGGDIRNQGILTLSEDEIAQGSTTSGSGGGISNDGGTLTLTHSLVWNNSSTNSGAGGDSGGIQNYGDSTIGPGHLLVIDSTIANNTAALAGGIFSWENSAPPTPNTTTIINSTIAFNDGGTRATNGGGLLVSQGTISVENSIVADNTVDNPASGTPSNCGASSPGVITSLGYNLESGTDCGVRSAGDRQSTDPGFLSGLSDYGGNTNTYALKATSPAVDAIPAGAPGCSGTDQRDVARPQGTGCDIGAFELSQPVEGRPFTTIVGAVSGTSVSIDWGDGTSEPVTPAPTTGQVTGTHTYAEEGIYHAVINYRNGDNTPLRFAFDVKVQDAPLSAAPSTVQANAGTPFSAPVATFTDANPAPLASDYSATIDWGDGSVSAGTVTPAAGGFQVSGTHTYTTVGSDQTTVSIRDAGGASTVAHGTTTVGPALGAPTPVVTGAPTVGSTTAGFSGSVNPDGLPTSAFVEYGLDPKYTGGEAVVYSQSTPAQSVGSDFASHAVSASVSGLVPNALYHVRLVATNSSGTTVGPDVAFTTLKAPPPGPPALGGTFNVSVVSGIVLVRLHGQLVPLTELEQIPVGTLIDALRGTISLTTAINGGGARDAAAKGKRHKGKTKTQKGTFGGAIFKITQAHSGLATLALVEGAFTGAPTYATCNAHKSADASAAALSSNTLQLLRSSAHGKFRTSGRYSAATVRGTKWTVADRCDGTLTHDITDSVGVSDFVRHKTIVLHAGQSYLAKAPKHR